MVNVAAITAPIDLKEDMPDVDLSTVVFNRDSSPLAPSRFFSICRVLFAISLNRGSVCFSLPASFLRSLSSFSISRTVFAAPPNSFSNLSALRVSSLNSGDVLDNLLASSRKFSISSVESFKAF